MIRRNRRYKNRIDLCVAGCMTHYLLWEILSPAEAEELLRLPWEITFPEVDNESFASGLSIYLVPCLSHSNELSDLQNKQETRKALISDWHNIVS